METDSDRIHKHSVLLMKSIDLDIFFYNNRSQDDVDDIYNIFIKITAITTVMRSETRTSIKYHDQSTVESRTNELKGASVLNINYFLLFLINHSNNLIQLRFRISDSSTSRTIQFRPPLLLRSKIPMLVVL